MLPCPDMPKAPRDRHAALIARDAASDILTGQLEWPWKRCPLMLDGFGGLALACLGVFAYLDRRPRC
jgi:hypothetical protein